jgi:hypothetical protein
MILGGNLNNETIMYSYCQHVEHLFNHCPFVNNILRQLLKDEVMNVHQHVIPTITTVLPNVPM